MTTRHGRARSGDGDALEALLAAGDHRAARIRAEGLLGDAAASPADRDAARAALARLRPERGAMVAVVAGLAFFLAVAVAALARGP